MDKLIESNIVCPISQEIFYEPVLAADGFNYEKSEILKWFAHKKCSPVLQNKDISTNLIPNHFVKSIVTSYLQMNPDKRAEQYRPNTSHKHNIPIIDEIFQKKNYIMLLSYKNFRPNLLKFYNLNRFIMHAPIHIIKHFIDYCTNLEYCYQYDIRLLHIIVQRKNLELVKYLVEQIIDINCQTIDGITPLHLAVYLNCREIVEYLLQSNAEVNLKDNYGTYARDYCRLFGDKKTMVLLMEYGAKFSKKPNSKMNIYRIMGIYLSSFRDISDSEEDNSDSDEDNNSESDY